MDQVRRRVPKRIYFVHGDHGSWDVATSLSDAKEIAAVIQADSGEELTIHSIPVRLRRPIRVLRLPKDIT